MSQKASFLQNDLSAVLSLDGRWDFSLGENALWGEIQVPGCWEAQGYSKYPDGPAFYRREVTLPIDWEGHTILAEFDAVSYACEVFCNGVTVGAHRGLWTPFQVDLTSAAQPGAANLLEVKTYKPGEHFPMRSSLAGFLPDVATTFGGLWQSARLRALRGGIDDLRVDGYAQSGQVRVRCRVLGVAGGEFKIEILQNEALVVNQSAPLSAAGELDVTLVVPNHRLWSPTNPTLYTVRVTLFEGGLPTARAERRIGFRRLSTEGNQLLLNGQPFMVRGILSWGWEPESIAPFYTAEQARAEMRRVREMGFNTIKLCLFVPNQGYFDVADEEGILLWQEYPLWLPEVTSDLRARAPQEYADLTRLIQHHPSVGLYSLGCELNQSVDSELLGQLNAAVRGQVADVLICDNSGSGESYGGLDEDFADFSDYHPYYDLHYFEPLLDNWKRDWQKPRPWIFGEFCDSDTFRNLDELIAANGGVPPWWLTRDNPVTSWRSEAKAVLEWDERLARAALDFTPCELTEISYAQSQVTRKYTLEAVRRRGGMGGYVITGLRDTPISTSGIWDDLYRAKWTAEEFRRANDEAVLSLDIDRRRRWTFGGDRPEKLDAHNFWAGDIAHWRVILSTTSATFPTGSPLHWTLSDLQGNVLAEGSSTLAETILPGAPRQVGAIICQLPDLQKASELRLDVFLLPISHSSNFPAFQPANHWPIWVYPPLAAPPSNLSLYDPTHLLEDCGEWLRGRGYSTLPIFGQTMLATVWDAVLEEFTRQGGRVILLQQGNGPLPVRRCPFWREGIKLFPAHPLWERFPQRGYADMQFFGLASDVAFDTPRLAEALPAMVAYKPIMRRLDGREFHLSDYLFEAQLGEGAILACSLRLQGGLGNQPFGWQRNVAGAALLGSMIDIFSALADRQRLA
jgi:hypothetical protein